MTAEDTPEQPGSDLTGEQKRKIVSFMRSDDRHVEIDPIKHFADWAVNYKRIINVQNVQPVCEQLKDGQWPDDDAALRAWWEAGGADEYRSWQDRKRAEEIYEMYQVLLDSQSPVLKLTGGDDTPRTMTIAGYVVITEGYRLGLDADDRDDCVTIHASELGAQDEVDERMEEQPDDDKEMSEIHPVTLTITSEPFVSEPLDRTESRRRAERPFQANDSPRTRFRAAFVERLLLILAVGLVGGLGYFSAYLANTDAALEKGRADKAIELRHTAELNASESGRLAEAERANAAIEKTLRMEAAQLAEAKMAIAEERMEFVATMKSVSREIMERAHQELMGFRAEDADQIAGEPFAALRAAGEIMRRGGLDDPELLAYYESARSEVVLQLVRFLWPGEELNVILAALREIPKQ